MVRRNIDQRHRFGKSFQQEPPGVVAERVPPHSVGRTGPGVAVHEHGFALKCVHRTGFKIAQIRLAKPIPDLPELFPEKKNWTIEK